MMSRMCIGHTDGIAQSQVSRPGAGNAVCLFCQCRFRVVATTSGRRKIALLDVVMETDDAGLRLVQRIRQELNNQLVRIVLRTGQLGQAPEQRVIVEYDINDYKAKTELTTQKLFTTVIASLRTYESADDRKLTSGLGQDSRRCRQSVPMPFAAGFCLGRAGANQCHSPMLAPMVCCAPSNATATTVTSAI